MAIRVGDEVRTTNVKKASLNGVDGT